MENTIRPKPMNLFAHKSVLRKIVAEQDALIGLEYDPAATAADAQRLILEDGVKPEDNLFSVGIVQAREE